MNDIPLSDTPSLLVPGAARVVVVATEKEREPRSAIQL
jgi:hypothetical protein